MSQGRAQALRLHWLGMLLLGWLVLMLLTLSPVLGQETPKAGIKKPWTGKLADGREITKGDLDKILQAHILWVRTFGREGQRADLHRAELSESDLSGAILNKANLSGANLVLANLSNALLISANLSVANLSHANLTGAYLLWADMTGASLEEANLQGTDLRWSNLSRATFEPKAGSIPESSKLISIRGLSSLYYFQSPHGLLELREVYKKAGLRDEERQVTFALNHDRWLIHAKRNLLGNLERVFQLFCFDLTCQYGMAFGRPLKILGVVLLLLTLPYMLALRCRSRKTGIWLVLMPNRVLGRATKDRPYKLTTRTPFRPLPEKIVARLITKAWRALRVLRLAFYFSLLSAFNLGWREFNVGNWISRLQKHEYTLRATGWARTVAGLQSLLSVYLLALWVLTYFGRPFD